MQVSNKCNDISYINNVIFTLFLIYFKLQRSVLISGWNKMARKPYWKGSWHTISVSITNKIKIFGWPKRILSKFDSRHSNLGHILLPTCSVLDVPNIQHVAATYNIKQPFLTRNNNTKNGNPLPSRSNHSHHQATIAITDQLFPSRINYSHHRATIVITEPTLPTRSNHFRHGATTPNTYSQFQLQGLLLFWWQRSQNM